MSFLKPYGLMSTFFVYSQLLQAASTTLWYCTIDDSNHQRWQKTSYYKQVALSKALELCKKQSIQPISCKAIPSNCELFINGISTRPIWQCVALDKMADSWSSNPYINRDKAALSAKRLCQTHSHVPDTCYMNLSTCQNLNQ